MLNRAQIKQNIKDFIKTDKCWLDMFIANIIPVAFGFCYTGVNLRIQNFTRDIDDFFDPTEILSIFGVSSFAAFVIAILIIPIAIAGMGYCLSKIRGQHPEQISVYQEAGHNYGRYLLTEIAQGFFVWCWSLLFVIPGIIKAYSYYFTNFIVHDNPNISATDAITLSRRITKGFKGQLFVLDLSFLLWDLLAAITCGIACIWVLPYKTATKAAFYEE
ncbi:MAG: DUF975 family protein, partial [Clostridiales bacterium]|nr:DUF975 family protein [Clostridiales bacterium]